MPAPHTTLEDCPFCGREGMIQEGPASQASGAYCVYRGHCERCDIGLAWTTDEREAAAAWNARVVRGSNKPETVQDITREMRRFMPNACGDWADRIEAALGERATQEASHAG